MLGPHEVAGWELYVRPVSMVGSFTLCSLRCFGGLKSSLSHADSASISNSANDCYQTVLGLVRVPASLLW